MKKIINFLLSLSLFISLHTVMDAQCTISNLSIDTGECIEANIYNFTFNFNVADNPSDLFDLYLNGTYYESYHIDDLPVTVDAFHGSPSGVDTLLVCMNDTESCCADALISNPCPCDYYNVQNHIISCTEDSLWFSLDFDYINVSDSFLMGTPGFFIGTFSVEDLPLEIGPFPRALSPAEILVSDQNDIFCFEPFTIDDEVCDQCMINNVTAIPGECNEDGNFFVDLSFEYRNVGEEGFKVVGNGNVYGEYLYEDSIALGNGAFMDSLIIGPLPGDCETVWEFVVIDIAVDGCENYTAIEPVCCDMECDVRDITLAELECTSPTTISFLLNFIYDNPGNDFFHLYSGDQHIGMFSLDQLPLFVEEFPVNEGETQVTVCINDQEGCCEEYIIEPLNCGDEFCDIYDLIVDGVECTSDETITFYLDFEYQNVENNFFEIYSNDELVAYFPLSELPLWIENFPIGIEETVLTVCINDVEGCCEEYVFENLDCSGFECEIGEIEYEIELIEQDSFLVILQFAYNGDDMDKFSIHGNGIYYGEFMYGELPVTLGPYSCNDSIPLEYVIRDLDNPDCQNVLELGVVDCTTNTQETGFDRLVVFIDSGQLIIKDPDLEINGDFSLRILSNLGEQLITTRIDNVANYFKIPVNNIPTGIYYVEIHHKELKQTFKVFINN